jgi:hypothetical protein
MQRRAFFSSVLLVLLGAFGVAVADETLLPLRTQAELMVKVAEYDRQLVRRQELRLILLVRRSNQTESMRTVAGLQRELGVFPTIAAQPHREMVVDFTSASALQNRIKTDGIAIVYIGPGLQDELPNIASALRGLNVLSFGAERGSAERGTVVSLELASGRARLIVNLGRARQQNVAFRPEFLRVARVIE